MPVLSLRAVAVAAGKDPKTLRLWCERGLVPGAERTGAHRHWKIRGKSACEVAAEAHRRAAGFSRRRLTKSESTLRQLQRTVAKSQKLNRMVARRMTLTRRQRTASKYATAVASALLDKSADELALLGLDESAVARLAWELPIHGKAGDTVIKAALCVWMAQSEDWTRAKTACCAGLSRRSLMRVFGRHWAAAASLVREMMENAPDVVAAWQKAGKDRRTGETIRQREQVTMPEGAEPEEIQKWKGALRAQ